MAGAQLRAAIRERNVVEFRYGGSRWGTDAINSERQFIVGVLRLTRIHARSVEEIVDIESDEMFKAAIKQFNEGT